MLATILASIPFMFISKPASAGWLSDWAYRIEITIEYTYGGTQRIDSTLTDYPILVYLSSASGIALDDVTAVFDELGSDANQQKIAITTSDGTTQCYAEIEYWSDATEVAYIWVNVPSISHTADTTLYLYFDSTKANNTSYIGLLADGSAATEAVWNSSYLMVHHMTGASAASLDDSTSNGNDIITDVGDPTYDQTSQIYHGVDFDGDDALDLNDTVTLSGLSAITIETWINHSSSAAPQVVIGKNVAGVPDSEFVLITGQYQRVAIYDHSTGNAYIGRDKTATYTGSWHHYCAIWDGGTLPTNCELYMDGTQIDDSSISGGAFVDVDDTTTEVNMARDSDAANYYTGLLDEMRISSIDRGAAWIKAGYYTGDDNLLTYSAASAYTEEPTTTDNATWQIQDAKVSEGYREASDWLVTIRYINEYEPYYDEYDPKRVFVMQLLESDNTTIAQTAMPSWGNRVGSIYLSADSTDSLEYGGDYKVRITAIFDPDEFIEMDIEDNDWLGSDLIGLDSWVITSATIIGEYYSTLFITSVAGRGEVLNHEGGVLMENGIPGLSYVRPNIFQTYSSTPGYEADDTITQAGRIAMYPWQQRIGDKGTVMITRLANVLNIDANAMICGIFIFITFIIAGYGFTPGHTTQANVICLIPLIGGVAFGVDMIIIGIICLVAIFLFVKGQWLDKGA